MLCLFVKCRVSAGTRKRRSKRAMSAAASIANLTWHELEPNMQGEQFLVPMANLILCFQSNFAGIFGQKIGYIRSKYVHLNAVVTLSNNKQNKYSKFSLTYFQNNMKTHNDLARRLFTLKRFQYCRFQNTNFFINVFPKFVVNLAITFAVCVNVANLVLIEE